MGRRDALAALGALAAWPALAACGDAVPATSPGVTPPPGQSPHRLSLVLGEPGTLDPALATTASEATVALALFEPLVRAGPNGAVTPAVAASWDVLDGGRAYALKLREGAKWNDGQRLSADDFAWAWKRNLDPEVGAAFNYLLFPIQGAQAYAEGRARTDEGVQVEAIDGTTLRVRLAEPTPGFLARLAHPVFYPLPRAEIEGSGLAWTDPRNLRSNGALKLVQWDKGLGLTAHRNEHYGGEPIPFRELVVSFAQDRDARLAAFRSGAADAVEVAGPEYRAARADDALRARLRLFERAGSWFLVANCGKRPWAQADVRRALSLALDRTALVNEVFDEPVLPAWSLTPPSITGREATPGPPDLGGARALLAGAGYPGGAGFPPAKFTYHTSGVWKRLALALARQWKEALGIIVTPDEREWRDFLAFTEDPGDYDLYRAGWTTEYRDPVNWFDDLWESKRDALRAHWVSDAFDGHLVTARRAGTVDARAAAYQQASAVLEAEAPAIPIAYRAAAYLLQARVGAFRIDPVSGGVDLTGTVFDA